MQSSPRRSLASIGFSDLWDRKLAHDRKDSPAKLLLIRQHLNLGQQQPAQRLDASSKRLRESESGRRKPNLPVLSVMQRGERVSRIAVDDEKKLKLLILPRVAAE